MRLARSRRLRRTAILAAASLLAAPVAIAAPAMATTSSPAGTFVLVSAPPRVSANATALFAFGARALGPGRVGSLQIAIPAGFTPRLPLGFGVTWRGLWTLT